MEINVEKKLLR